MSNFKISFDFSVDKCGFIIYIPLTDSFAFIYQNYKYKPINDLTNITQQIKRIAIINVSKNCDYALVAALPDIKELDGDYLVSLTKSEILDIADGRIIHNEIDIDDIPYLRIIKNILQDSVIISNYECINK